MDVVESSLKSILEGSKQYVIPLYQRPYAWRSANWQKLWEDLVDIAIHRQHSPEDSHFTGTLVLDASSVTTDLTKFLVVDGQQRLTTMSVLLAAIANSWSAQGEKEAAERIQEQVLINRHAKSLDERYRLRPANFDEPVYRSAVDGSLIKSSQSNVDDAYLFFQKKIERLHEFNLTLAELESAALTGLKFVTITAKRDDNVYRIFESINNTGVDLSQADLIRNLVFMKLGSEGERIHESIWLPIQKDLSSEDIENLFWIDARWRDVDVRKLDTYEMQKKFIETLDKEALVAFLENILLISNALRLIRQPEHLSDSNLRKRLTRIGELKVPGVLVLVTKIMYLHITDVINATEAADALYVLESYLMRRAIAAVPVNDLGGVSATCALNLGADTSETLHKLLSTGRRKYLTDAQIERVILESPMYSRGRRDHLKKIIQWLLEEQDGKDSVDYDSMSIEHVLPQTLTGQAYEEFSVLVPEEENVQEVHESLVHTLGNLTLTNYNSELSNKAFSVKSTTGLAKTSVQANHEIARNKQWGPHEITSRSAALAQAAIKLWQGPDEALLEKEPSSVGERIDEVISVIPAGRWASYGDIAEVVGTASQVVGQRAWQHPKDGFWRVLRTNGEVSPGFNWPEGSPFTGRDPRQVLSEEGLLFDESGLALAELRLGPEVLLERLGEGLSENQE